MGTGDIRVGYFCVFSIFALTLTDITVHGQAAITVTCPPIFEDHDGNIISCSLNTAVATSEGCSRFGAMNFQLTIPGQNVTTPCSTSTSACELENSSGCKCDNDSTSIQTYSWIFTANSSIHANSNLSCMVPCLPTASLSVSFTGRCHHIIFGPPSTGGPTKRTSDNSGIIAGAVCACVVVLSVGLCAANWFFLWFPRFAACFCTGKEKSKDWAPAQLLTAAEFDQFIKSNSRVLVIFFDPYRQAAWKKAFREAAKNKQADGCLLAAVNVRKDYKLIDELKIKSYLVIVDFRNGRPTVVRETDIEAYLSRQTQQTGESKHKGSGSGSKKNRPPKEQETELSTVRETSSPSQNGSAEEDERRHVTPRALPQPKAAGEDSIGLAGSATPRKLPPLKQPGMPSVERNSFADPGHTRDLPLPSIKQKM